MQYSGGNDLENELLKPADAFFLNGDPVRIVHGFNLLKPKTYFMYQQL
jgi:hypothetical protein